MKRYVLFAGDFYYPLAGWNDRIERSDQLDELVAEGEKRLGEELYSKGMCDWYQIVDLQEDKIVAMVRRTDDV